MNPNSNAQEEGGSVTGWSNRREVEHLPQSFKDAIVFSIKIIFIWYKEKALKMCQNRDSFFKC